MISFDRKNKYPIQLAHPQMFVNRECTSPESTMTNFNSIPHRELGIEFGELAGQIEEQSYPITNEELVKEYGEHIIEFPNGTESVRDILSSVVNETYESPSEARQALFNMVDSRAIGRSYYDDDRWEFAPGGEGRITPDATDSRVVDDGSYEHADDSLENDHIEYPDTPGPAIPRKWIGC